MDMGDNSRNGLYDALWCGVDHSPIGQLQPYRSLLESILVDLHQGLVLPRHESIEPYFRSFERGHRFLLCCLPMLMLRHFDIDRRKKIALNAVFSLGLLVVAASAVRTYYLEKLGTATDLTWIGFDVFVWSQLEVQLAMICASAPALRVLFRRYLRDGISHTVHTNSWITMVSKAICVNQNSQTWPLSTR